MGVSIRASNQEDPIPTVLVETGIAPSEYSAPCKTLVQITRSNPRIRDGTPQAEEYVQAARHVCVLRTHGHTISTGDRQIMHDPRAETLCLQMHDV